MKNAIFMKNRKSLSTVIYLIFLSMLLCVLLTSCGREEESPDNKIIPDMSLPTPQSDWKTTTVSGSVQIPDRDDQSGVLVYASGKSLMAYTDRNGEFTLLNVPLGDYEFMGRLDGYEVASLGTIIIEGTPRNPPEPVRLSSVELEKKPEETEPVQYGGIVGKVENEKGDAAEGVLVQIEGTLFKTVTDDQGVFRFFNMKPKAYTLNFSKAGYVPQSKSLNVQPGSPTFTDPVQLKPINQESKSRKIYGTVDMYDLKGEPVNKFNSVIVALEGTSYVALPDSQGNFTFEVSPGKYTITANAPGFENRSKIDVDLTELEYTNVSVILDKIPSEEASQGILRGAVKLEDEEDHSGVSVALTGTSKVAVTDSAGRYELTGIPEGEYTLLAQTEGFITIAMENIRINPGEELELETITLERRVNPPEVIYTDPGNGESDVMVQEITPVFIRFSKQMKPDSLRRAFSIRPSVDYKIYAGRQSRYSDYDLMYVELAGTTTANPLQFDTRYTITISTAAEDFEDLTLEEEYEFTFNTGEASVTGTTPADGATGAFITNQRPIYVYFNAPLDPDTVNTRNISIEPDTYVIPDVRLVEDPETGWATIRIFTEMEPDTRYTVRIGSGVLTENGSGISNLPYTFRFRTSKRREFIQEFPR